MPKFIEAWLQRRKRAHLMDQLDHIYEMRKACDDREKAVTREIKRLDAMTLHQSIPTRARRMW